MKRIQRVRGLALPAGARYVGRPTRWGNPYRVEHSSVHGWGVWAPGQDWPRGEYELRSAAHAKAVDLYRSYAEQHLLDHLGPLVGRDLACWCSVELPCHADVLLELCDLQGGGL